MSKALTITFALLLSGCLVPHDTLPRVLQTYHSTEPTAYAKITTIYDHCDADAPKPYLFPPAECTEYYDYHSGRYEGKCCTWGCEEWCDWIDNCVGWRYTGSVSH